MTGRDDVGAQIRARGNQLGFGRQHAIDTRTHAYQ